MKSKLMIIIIVFLIIPMAFVHSSLKPIRILENKENEQISETDLIVVGFSQLGSESDWRSANTKSIQQALSVENGFSLIYQNGRQRQENQIKDVRSFIFQEVDYIVIAPSLETGWDTVLEEAKKAQIPVILVDRLIDTKDENLYVTSVGTDKYEEGKKAGIWLEQFEGPLNIVVLEGTPNSTAQLGRSRGFEEIAALHPDWNILAKKNGDFTKAKGKEVMTELLQEFEQIDVLVSQNDDMTFGAIEAIQEAGKTCGVEGEIKVISFDAVSEAFDLMEEGLINVDIECNPLQGELLAQIIERLEKGDSVEKAYYVYEKIFEAANASVDRIGRSY